MQEHEAVQLLPLTVPEVRRLRLRGWCGKLLLMSQECWTGPGGAGDIRPELNNHTSNDEQPAWLPKCGCSARAYPNNPVRYFSVRQGIVNRFVLCECCSGVPFPSKGRLVKCCSCRCNNLLERFALSRWEWGLCLFAKGCCCCTQTRGQRIVPFCADSGGKAFEARGNVGGTAECTIERERFSVARFGLGIVVLLASQVTK